MTADKYQDGGKSKGSYGLEKMLDGVQKKVVSIRDMLKGMYDKVNELATTTDAIYETVSYHHDSPPYSPNHDDFLDELEE